MIEFAPAKINIGLYVTGKRIDGYHDIETVFYPIPFYDVVEIIDSDKFNLYEYGHKVDCSPKDNLCTKAFELIQKEYKIPNVEIHLLKNIPSQSGLGGGSSDAVAVLKCIDKKFNLKISDEKMYKYALQLGSDCPFFIKALPSLAKGRGEKLEKIDINLKGLWVLIIRPDFDVSTACAFKSVMPDKNNSLRSCIKLPINSWRNCIVNCFESNITSNKPQLKSMFEKLYDLGALYVSLTGSGSAFYAFFNEMPSPIRDVVSNYKTWRFKI